MQMTLIADYVVLRFVFIWEGYIMFEMYNVI